MKKCMLMLCLLFLALFAQVSMTQAVSKAYTWQIDDAYSEYEIYIVTQDHWKTDTEVDVVVRLTLTDKHWSLDHTRTNWIQIIVKSSKFIVDSGRQAEEVTLTHEGDYWQKTIQMQIPSSKLEQGENITMSLESTINIDEFDTVQHKWWNHVGSTSYDPIHADVTRPIPMFWETPFGILATVAAVIAIGSIVGFIIYRTFFTRRTKSV